jgi:hypothetical protein
MRIIIETDDVGKTTAMSSDRHMQLIGNDAQSGGTAPSFLSAAGSSGPTLDADSVFETQGAIDAGPPGESLIASISPDIRIKKSGSDINGGLALEK